MVRSTRKGDVVVCPTRDGRCSVGLITGGYEFAPGQPLPHRRPVEWVSYEVERLDLGEAAQTAMKAGGTIVELPRTEELERFGLSLNQRLVRAAISNEIENPASFVMEEHLEAFLERNWEMTAFGKNFDLYQEDGEVVGRQFRTDTGPLDLLAVSKDGSRLLVIELKRGRAGDKVVGQILRYMSFVQAECAEPGQKVEGAIVALDDSLEIRRALEQVPHVKFYRYRIDFHLEQG